jgi:hypothetical protein
MLTLAFILVSAAPAPAPGPAECRPEDAQAAPEVSDAQLRNRIESYLGGIDVRLDPSAWRELGPRAVPILEQLARDPEQLPTRRARALGALAIIAAPTAPAVFSELAGRTGEPLTVRVAAIRGLGAVTPEAQLSRTLRPYLEKSPEPRLRATAAEQLAVRTRGKACDVVRAHLDREDADVKPMFDRAAQACSAVR